MRGVCAVCVSFNTEERTAVAAATEVAALRLVLPSLLGGGVVGPTMNVHRRAAAVGCAFPLGPQVLARLLEVKLWAAAMDPIR